MLEKTVRVQLVLCMIVRDEAAMLAQCLDSVKGVADDILIGDTGSSDETPDVARDYGATVVPVPWTDSFSDARNHVLESVTTADWILMLDADERLAASRAQLDPLLLRSDAAGYFVPVRSFVGPGDGPGPDYLVDYRLSLFRHNPTYRFQGDLHEDIVRSIREHGLGAELPVASFYIDHFGYLDPIREAKQKSQRNNRIITQNVSKHPDDARVRYWMAAEAMGNEQFDRADRLLASLAREWKPSNPVYSDVLKKHVVSLLRQNRVELAKSVLDGALDLFPAFTDLHYLEAGINFMRGDLSGALESLTRCLQLGDEPIGFLSWGGVGSFRAIAFRGEVYAQQGDWAGAFASFLEAMAVRLDYREPLRSLIDLIIKRHSALPTDWPRRLKQALDVPGLLEVAEQLAAFGYIGLASRAVSGLRRNSEAGWRLVGRLNRARAREVLMQNDT